MKISKEYTAMRYEVKMGCDELEYERGWTQAQIDWNIIRGERIQLVGQVGWYSVGGLPYYVKHAPHSNAPHKQTQDFTGKAGPVTPGALFWAPR
ncbi:hypothetical protein FOPE_10052 [Fonsecaea pedrosoi]|nr:hypothetical protein FOPE_10052 [Fonsecaea pedrosoi]